MRRTGEQKSPYSHKWLIQGHLRLRSKMLSERISNQTRLNIQGKIAAVFQKGTSDKQPASSERVYESGGKVEWEEEERCTRVSLRALGLCMCCWGLYEVCGCCTWDKCSVYSIPAWCTKDLRIRLSPRATIVGEEWLARWKCHFRSHGCWIFFKNSLLTDWSRQKWQSKKRFAQVIQFMIIKIKE